MEKLIEIILDLFKGFLEVEYGREILVFIISLLPVLELRGALLAATILKVQPVVAYILSIIGNVLPIPFILLLLRYNRRIANRISELIKSPAHFIFAHT